MNGKPAAGAFASDAGFVYEHRKSPKAENESSFACKIGKEKMQFLLRYRQRIRCRQLAGSVILYFGVAEPLLEFLQRDDLAVAFLLFFSGFLAPGIKLLISDAPGFDPREALFILLAVRLENRVVGLLFCPLTERADLAAALLAVL